MPKVKIRFGGMNNVLDAAEIPRDDVRGVEYSIVSDLLNVDPGTGDKARRRQGYRRLHATAFHSVFRSPEITCAVTDNLLQRIEPDYSLATVRTLASSKPVHAVDTPVGLVYSNGTDIGMFMGATHWLLPDPPAEVTVDDITVPSFKERMPAGQYVAWFGGMLYTLRYENGESWLYHSDGYDLVWDSRDGYLRFPGAPTALAAVDDGIYVGAGDRLYFLAGGGPEDFAERRALDFSVVPGAFAAHRAEDIGLKGGRLALLFTTSGFVLGGNGGVIEQKQEIAPTAAGAGLMAGVLAVRQERGESHLVAVLRGTGATASRYTPEELDLRTY